MSDKPSVAVLGAGVSGLTTGIILNLAGYATSVYAADLPTRSGYEYNEPRFATLYAAASVLPHGVTIDQPVFHLERSQAFFDRLEKMGDFAVGTQRHYELFEQHRPNPPEYLSAARNLSEVSPDRCNIYRQVEVPVYGWVYDAYVVDMPPYMRQLLTFYRETGGSVVEGYLRRRDLLSLEEDLLVNCGGMKGRALVDDPAPYEITRGHLVYVDVPTAALSDEWTPLSYNYMPVREVYCQPDGRRADVYFYPRTDRWILGGSRQVIESDRHRHERSPEYPSVTINDIDVPRPIVDLNRRLLKQLAGVDIAEYPMQAAFGYRYERRPVRLEPSLEDGRRVIHNYGHGGGGVTFSWSCAVEVLDIIESNT